ncbi:TraC family protein [Persephonella sp.]
MEVQKYRKLFEREKIIKYLPYAFYDEDEKIYINRDESVGFIVECYPLQYPFKKAFDGLMSAISTLPEGASMQVILYASPDITQIIDTWKGLKTKDNEISKGIVEAFSHFYEEKTWERLSLNYQSAIRNYRVLISVKLGGKEREYTIFDKIFNPRLFFERKEGEDIKKQIERLKQVKDRFIGALDKAFLHPKILDPTKLSDFLYPLLNPSHDYREKPEKVPTTDISRHLVAYDTIFEVYEDYIKIDGIYGKSLAVKEYPEYSSFVKVMDYIGNEVIGEAFENPFMVVLNAVILPEKARGKVKRNATLVLNQQMPYALFPSLKFKHQDLSYGMEKLEKGAQVIDMTLSFFVFARDEDTLANRMIGVFKSYFRNKEFILEEDKYINLAVFLTNLPFGYDLTASSFLDRSRVAFAENLADLTPVCADWRGTKPEVLLITPRGQLVGFDLFSSQEGGYNSFVIGTTGSGKSVLLQYFATMYYMSGNKIRIIDIGRSYERFAYVFDGQFIELNMAKPISLNPFTNLQELSYDETKIGVVEEDDNNAEGSATDLEFLTSLFLLMGLPAEPKKALELRKLMKAYLDEAILESWNKYKQDSCVDTVVEMLSKYKDKDHRVDDFVRTMRPYTSKGLYGKFFNGASNIHFNADIVVMENDTIENIPDLRDPAIMLLTYHISKEVYMGYHDDLKFLVMIDEAHKFLGNPQIDLFVEQAYRRFRKHNASIILGTQGFEDFYGGEKMSRAGRVIVQNSYWKFFLLQTATSRQALKKSDYFNLSEYEESIMDSINTVKGEYGEGYLISENIKLKFRVVLDDFLKALYFSDPEVRAKIKKLVNSGMSYLEAVRTVMKEIK